MRVITTKENMLITTRLKFTKVTYEKIVPVIKYLDNKGYSTFINYKLKFRCLIIDFRVLIGPYFKFCLPAWLTCYNSPRKCTPLNVKRGEQALALYHTLKVFSKGMYKVSRFAILLA